MLLLLAALPSIWWDGGPQTAPQLREAGITAIRVPAAQRDAWKNIAGIAVETANLDGAVKLEPPAVDYRINRAGATAAPWLNSNGWRFLRNPGGRFYYEARGEQSALAAAEAFAFGADAMVHSDEAGLKPLGAMLRFLGSLAASDLPPVADIGFVDDGSADAGEVMNLMVRGNLLFRAVPPGDKSSRITVRLADLPGEDAKNPPMAAHEIRARLTDDRRSVRIYGTEVVVTRLFASGGRLRVMLLNYAGAERKVAGVRVRVLGRFERRQAAVEGSPDAPLIDYAAAGDATEFTLSELKTLAVIDLIR
jgi:hypothetical protein